MSTTDLETSRRDVLPYRRLGDSPELPPALSSKLARAVLVLWLLPLVVGVGIFTVSELVRAKAISIASGGYYHGSPVRERLELYGVRVIGVGTFLAAAAFICVLCFVFSRRNHATAPWRQVYAPAVWMCVLLASNFVTAVILAMIALR